VAVVGAGLAGLACARALAADGARVTVLEKSRGPGGRAATRHAAPVGEGAAEASVLAYDHGAQYATARDARFVAQLEAWRARGVVAEWAGRFVALAGGTVGPTGGGTPATRRWVGVPGMRALGSALAEDVERHGAALVRGARVAAARRAGDGTWTLTADGGATHGAYDAVIVAVPAPQAVPLLAAVPRLSAQAAAVRMTPCWSAMLAVAAPLGLPFDGAFVNAPTDETTERAGSLVVPAGPGAPGAPALAWIARDSAKPGRALPEGVTETWVLHAGPAWSEAHLELAPEDVARRLLAELAREARVPVHAPIVHLAAHRWRYATPAPPLDAAALWDADTALGACGDWCGGPRVEGAYLSGLAAAERVLATLGARLA
jgi:predicted NAD/FAD-dependent oxidoreductase